MSPIPEINNVFYDRSLKEAAHDITETIRYGISTKEAEQALIAPTVVHVDNGFLLIDGEKKYCPIRTIVEYRYFPRVPDLRVENWIPEGHHHLETPTYSRNGKLLELFGIERLLNFRYLGRNPLNRLVNQEDTVMELKGVENWISFHGYNRNDREDFDKLRRTVATLALLPKDVWEQFLPDNGLKQAFLLALQNRKPNGELDSQYSAIARVSPGLKKITVEPIDEAVISQKELLRKEKYTPVVVFRSF